MSDKLPLLRIPAEEGSKVAALEQLVIELWQAVQDLQETILVPQKLEPKKLTEGLIRYADGTNWDPGSGAGLYQYLSSAWVKL
jgi:hypothetical protein